jgi:hypothetical protein
MRAEQSAKQSWGWFPEPDHRAFHEKLGLDDPLAVRGEDDGQTRVEQHAEVYERQLNHVKLIHTARASKYFFESYL